MSIETAMNEIRETCAKVPFCLEYHKDIEAFCTKHGIAVGDLLQPVGYPKDFVVHIESHAPKLEPAYWNVEDEMNHLSKGIESEYYPVLGHMELTATKHHEYIGIRIINNPGFEGGRRP